jgi:spore germination protein KC
MNRKFLICLPVFMLLFLSGCGDIRELNEIGIVVYTAIDKKEDQWLVSYQVVNPSTAARNSTGGGGEGAPVFTFTTSGETLQQAIQNTNLEEPRRLFFAHNSAVIISEEIAREGVSPVIDYYLRSIEDRATEPLFIAEKAMDILDMLDPSEPIPGRLLPNMMERGEKNMSKYEEVDFTDFVIAATSESKTAVIPQLVITGDKEGQTSMDALSKTRRAGTIKLGNLGAFNKDKLAGWLTTEEARGVAWITGEIEEIYITFDCHGKKEGPPQSTYLLTDSSVQLTPRLTGSRIEMELDIYTEGRVSEVNCAYDLSQPDNIDKMAGYIEERISLDVEAAWAKAKELNADVMGFANEINNRHRDKWKELKGIPDKGYLEQIDLITNVNVDIENTGINQTPFSSLIKE